MTTLLTRKQAAQFLGVKFQTLAVWAMKKNPNLPFIKNGRYVRYRLEDLEEFTRIRG